MGELPLAPHTGDRIFARLVNRRRGRIGFDRLLVLGWGCNSHQSTSESTSAPPASFNRSLSDSRACPDSDYHELLSPHSSPSFQAASGVIPELTVILGVVVVSVALKRLGRRRLTLFPHVAPRVDLPALCRRRLPETAERDLIGAWLLPRVRSVRSPVAPSVGGGESRTIVAGVDVHKQSLTAVAVDEVGRSVAEQTVGSAKELVSWSASLHEERLWAVEDCRQLSGALERALLAAGKSLVRVPPKLRCLQRRAGRARGKSDPIDALAVARAALREPRLDRPRRGEQALRELKLLTDHRDDLVDERRRAQQRLRWQLHDLARADGPARWARPHGLASTVSPAA